MASTAAPYGVQVAEDQSGIIRPQVLTWDCIANGSNSAMYQGQPVTLSSGLLAPITTSASSIYGIFMGCTYLASSTASVFTNAPNIAASTTYVAGSMKANVITNPAAIYRVQSAGSITAASLGKEISIANGVVANNNALGYSTAAVKSVTTTTSSQGQFLIWGFQIAPDSAVGDAFTDLLVKVANFTLYPVKTSI